MENCWIIDPFVRNQKLIRLSIAQSLSDSMTVNELGALLGR